MGQPLKRKEDRRLLIGDGQYLPDLVVPRMVIMGLVRSIHAHAKSTRIDTAQAAALPGVLAVVTGDEFAGWDPILSALSTPNLPGETKRPVYWPLSRGEVKYVGDPLVAVVPRDKYTLSDDPGLVAINNEPLPVGPAPECTLRAASPRPHLASGGQTRYP